MNNTRYTHPTSEQHDAHNKQKYSDGATLYRHVPGGLARVTTAPEKREYMLAQFLGEQQATVPRVLTDALRTNSTQHSG